MGPAFPIGSHRDVSSSETGGNQEEELQKMEQLASWSHHPWEVQCSHGQAISAPLHCPPQWVSGDRQVFRL